VTRDAGMALEAFARLLGDEHVVRDAASVTAARQTTYATNRALDAIVRPGTVEDVRACLRIATEHGAAVFPISRGRNWGYGSRVPPRDCVVILDLGRLDRIVAHDEDLAYVTVEPGVTFAQLVAYLREKKSRLFAAVTGGPPQSSVVGNVLERGVGKGPYADRFQFSCGYEVALPNGDLVHTGYGRYANAHATPVARFGPGPILDGLFAQANLGVVTKMTIWLTPIAAHAATFFFAMKTQDRLGPVVDALRTLRLEGTLRSSSLIANDVRRMAFVRQYPWEEAGGVTPIPLAVREELRRGVAWSGDGSIYPPTIEHARADKARIRGVLGPVVDALTWSDEPDPSSPIPPEVLAIVHGLATGQPVERTAATAYWRKRGPVPDDLDPDRDRCGFISFSPAIPFEGSHARRSIALLDTCMVEYGFDPNLGLNCASDRAIDLTPMLLFDRDVPGEDERAMACHDAMLERLAASGYYPYRLCTEAMDKLPAADDDTLRLMATLKRAIDPRDILAPGRYDFRSRWP